MHRWNEDTIGNIRVEYLHRMQRVYDKEIERMQEKKNITSINAVIYCEKASHKGIVISKHGEMLKKVGTMARADIEKMLGKKVYLELWVRVKNDWRNNNYLMKNFGFTSGDEL